MSKKITAIRGLRRDAKLFGLIMFCLVLMLVTLTGCQSPANSGATATSGDTIFGRVTAVDGNNITIEIMNTNGFGGNNQGGTGGSASSRPQRSPGTRPSGSGGQYPQSSGGTAPSGGYGQLPQTSGESKTFTVTSSTVITSGGMRQYQGSNSAQPSASASPASLSDIQVGSILSVTLSGDNATAITIMQMGNGNGNRGGASASGSPSPGDTASPADSQPGPSAAPSPSAPPASANSPAGATPTPSIGAMISY